MDIQLNNLSSELTLKTFLILVTICLLMFMYSIFTGLFLIIVFIISIYIVQSPSIQKQFQDILFNLLESNKNPQGQKVERNDGKFYVAKDLDKTLENFFNRLLDQFITSWYSNVSNDKSFVCTVKYEIALAVRNLVARCIKIDYPMVITNKLLPVVYTHISEIKHSIHAATQSDQIKSYIADSHQIHPATVSRKAEIKYLRSLSESLIPHLFTSKNLNCKTTFSIVRELFANWIFLTITDVIAEPDIINMLVILATNQKSNPIKELRDVSRVEILENFSKFMDDENQCKQQVDGKFFNDQEKLYNFMQFLKSRDCKDVEILKFVLDVEHMNAELEKTSVVSDPKKLTNLQQMSEKLLSLYRDELFSGSDSDKPKDLIDCYSHARQYLEYKWKYDFYKSADYYKYIYGDRDSYKTFNRQEDEVAAAAIAGSSDISSQKLAARIKRAMSMKIAVDGIEEGDIQIFDALDEIPVSPFNSMAVRLRKEKGQDLDGFMKILYHSIEQEGDVGEDIVQTQTKSERQRNKMKFGNIELYQNLFNLAGQSTSSQIAISTFIKTPTQSLLYFLAEILKFNDFILRIATGLFKFMPNSDQLICLSIRKIAEKLINQAVVVHLIKELEEKIFDQKAKSHPSQKELDDRKVLAMERLDKIKCGLSNNLVLLQNPVFNKHLVYCLLDTIVIEVFSELDPNSK